MIVYRDRPEYVEARTRWAAYQAEVLQADLSKGLGLRPAVIRPDGGLLGKIDRVTEFVERLHPDHWGDWGREELPRTATVGHRFEPLERPRCHPVRATARRGRRVRAAAAAASGRRPVRRPPDAARARLGSRGLGVILIIGGLAAIAFGIAAAVGARDQIETDAVARGLSGEPFGFTAAEPDDYTVFLVDAFGGTEAQERAVARTSCMVSFSIGGTQFSGASQGFSLTLGSASSIGHFDAPAAPWRCCAPARAPASSS